MPMHSYVYAQLKQDEATLPLNRHTSCISMCPWQLLKAPKSALKHSFPLIPFVLHSL